MLFNRSGYDIARRGVHAFISELLSSHQQAGKVDKTLVDAMIHDGLWDSFGDLHMGTTGEIVAEKYGITRARQERSRVVGRILRSGYIGAVPVIWRRQSGSKRVRDGFSAPSSTSALAL